MSDKINNLFGDLLRGHTDTIILSILTREDSYGYRINKTLEKESEGKFYLNEATLYRTFKRLEKEGYIESYWKSDKSTPSRKYYSITKSGIEYLNQNILDYKDATEIIKHFIESKKE